MSNQAQYTHRQYPRGVAVLFALMITALVTLIGLGISYIIIRELNLSQNIDSATRAYYAADSGVERGLHRITFGRENQHALSDIVAGIRGYAEAFSGVGSSYDTADSNSSTGIEVGLLEENLSVQADYTEVNPTLADGSSCTTNGSCVASWLIAWDATDPQSTATSIEATFIGWRDNAGVTVDTETQKIIKLITPPDTGLREISLPESDKLYRFRLKSLGGDLKDVRVTAHFGTESPASIPGTIVPSSSSITVKAKGLRGQFAQAISAVVPWQPPLSGIFDYVIFSENTLQKINPIVTNPPIYRSGRIEIEKDEGGAFCSCVVAEGSSCDATGWAGGCDSGGGDGDQVARCNEVTQPAGTNTCSITRGDFRTVTTDLAGLYVEPNINALGFPSGEYYVRIEGYHAGTQARIILDDEQLDIVSEGFTPPDDTGGGDCRFNCLFTNPVKLGYFCTGGDSVGSACTTDADCPGTGGACSVSPYTKLFFQGEHNVTGPGGTKTYLDWYSISSSPLLTGPSDTYCRDFTPSDCQ